MSELRDILDHLNNQQATPDEINRAANEVFLGKVEIPQGISIESTMQEIQNMTTRLYKTLEQFPRDVLTQSKIIALLEMKTKILGLTNIKPDVQDIIDSEINLFKRRFLDLAVKILTKDQMQELANRLATEGL